MSVEEVSKNLEGISLKDWVNINVNSRDEVLAFARKEWESKAMPRKGNQPLYPGAIIDEIVYLVIRSWIQLENHLLHPEIHDPLTAGCNILLTGPRGVGKTTLMKELAAIILKNHNNVIPIYHDYEQSGMVKPSSLMKDLMGDELFKELTQDTYDDFVKQKGKAFIVMGDEVQAWYNNEDGIAVAREFISLGKSIHSGNHLWIIF